MPFLFKTFNFIYFLANVLGPWMIAFLVTDAYCNYAQEYVAVCLEARSAPLAYYTMVQLVMARDFFYHRIGCFLGPSNLSVDLHFKMGSKSKQLTLRSAGAFKYSCDTLWSISVLGTEVKRFRKAVFDRYANEDVDSGVSKDEVKAELLDNVTESNDLRSLLQKVLNRDYEHLQSEYNKSKEDVDFMWAVLMNGQVYSSTRGRVYGAWWLVWYVMIGFGCSHYWVILCSWLFWKIADAYKYGRHVFLIIFLWFWIFFDGGIYGYPRYLASGRTSTAFSIVAIISDDDAPKALFKRIYNELYDVKKNAVMTIRKARQAL